MDIEKKLRDFIYEWKNTKLKKFNTEDLELKNSRRILTNPKYFGKREYSNIELSTTYPYIDWFDIFLTSVLGWIHCNPSKPNTIKLSQEAFCFPKKHDENIRSLNSKQGLKNFFNYLTRKNGGNGDIAIIAAPKGTGKTYTQNYFLNTYTRKLGEKGFTWFRIDLTKILKYEKRFGTKLSLADYLYAQIVYVFFRYHKPLNDEIGYDHIFSNLDINIIKGKVQKKYNSSDFEREYQELESFCRINKNLNDGLNKPFNQKITAYLAFEIINNLKSKNYDYILFIDGIDNVDYAYDKNLLEWTKQIFEGDIAKTIRPSSLILSCRPETLTFIHQIYNGNMPFNIQEYFLDNLQPEDLLKNLNNYILNNDGFSMIKHYYNTYKNNLEDNNLDYELYSNVREEIIHDFINFGFIFKKLLLLDINKRHKNIDINLNENNIIEVLYNHSLRDMLYDIKYSFMYIHHYIITEHKRKHLKVKTTVTEFISKNNGSRSYLLTAAIARHGRIYFNDKNLFVPPYRLLHSFNLFNLLDLKSKNGLFAKDMLIPLLILLILKKDPYLSLKEIKQKCQVFGYNNKQTIEYFQRKLLEHGLIEIDIHGRNEKSFFKNLPRVITERGKFTLLSIENMDILHAFSYEIYFPKSFISYNIVKAYKNDFSEIISAQIMNVLSLLKLLQTYADEQNIDIDFFKKNLINELITLASRNLSNDETRDIIKKFKRYMYDHQINNSLINQKKSIDELLTQYDQKEITKEELTLYLKNL